MKILFLFTGKTREEHINTGLRKYIKRIERYFTFHIFETPDVKKVEKPELQIASETEKLLKKIEKTDFVVLLDEKGKELSSKNFANFIEKKSATGTKRLIFIIAGAYGAHTLLHKRANMQLSLSKMTFPHQLVRLIFAEQFYRACTILRNEPYHHE